MAELAGLDVYYLVKEFQVLVNSRVENIYQWNKSEFLFKLRSIKGKFDLKVEFPNMVYLSKNSKKTPQEPPGFCSQLRNKFKGVIIKEIYQKGFERIIVFKDNHENKLILELFKPGNMILVDNEDKIIQVLNHRTFKDRSLRPKRPYVFPPGKNNTKKISKKEIDEILLSSTKELGITLATQLGFGGKYANEICARAGIKKSETYKDLSESDKKKIIVQVRDIFNQELEPNITENKSYPIKMLSLEDKEVKRTEMFSEALESNVVSGKEENKKEPPEIIKLRKLISSQEKKANQLEKEIEENNAIGEFIYSNYKELETFLKQAGKILGTKKKEKLKEFLESKKGFKEYNKKEKKVVFEF